VVDLRPAIAPAYLFLCLLLGGSGQGIWNNLLLQLAGFGLIVWAAVARDVQPLPQSALRLMLLALAMLAVVALQLVPLPAALWPHLGAGRERVAAGFQLLGMAAPSLPMSLTPDQALSTLAAAVPAIALYCAIVRLRAYRESWLALALVGGTMAGVLLGALQVAGGDGTASPWYLYRQVNRGLAVGFFANANHMGNLLVITLPFVAALLAGARGTKVQHYSGMVALAAGIALVIIAGIALNGSIAAYVLAVPVAGASALLLVKLRQAARRWLAAAVLASLSLAAGVLALGPLGERALGSSASVESRAALAANTLAATEDFLPFGSGLGSFRQVYKLYENEAGVERVVVNHAHNDYLELALETGIPGAVIVLLFLWWWASTVRRVWRFSDYSALARAATIASAALLVHSLVDYPLRTEALAAVFGMCLALMTMPKPKPQADESELWPTRHVVLG
jgi:O-antigen ligase